MTKRTMEHQQPNGAEFMVAAVPPGGPGGDGGGGGVNGMLSPPGSLNNNDAKRVKLDTMKGPGGGGGGGGVNAPSRVIHIRNIPSDVTEAEIIHLGIPFGRVTNVLVLKGKNQAFLEMEDEQAATAMVNYFTNCVAQLRERSVYVQYSNHRELKTDQTHSNASASAQAALQAAQALSGQEMSTGGAGGKQSGAAGAGAAAGGGGGPNTVLRVIVEHMVYPVTLDVIYQIFSRVGKVLKVVTFTKNNTFQALIQYPDVITAQAAKLSLDGQNIYNACCTLRIEYSKLSNLNVKYNNDKSRDYTNPSLPTGDHNLDSALQLGGVGGPGVLGSPFSAAAAMSLAASNPLAVGAYGSMGGLNASSIAAAGMSGMAGLAAFPLGGSSAASHHAAAAAAAAAAFGQSQVVAGLRFPGVAPASTGCVLLVSNLNETETDCDHLFILFGVYGDVQRVKILFNKKDTALIQMAEPQQAMLAMNHLDKQKLWGKQIRVMPSKHTTVQLPKEGQPDAGLTKDYANSNLHRFKKPGSKNYSNIYPPSATLHLSNIPSTVNEEDLKAAFAEIATNVQAFKFFPKDRKMALVQLASQDEAIVALVKMHNFQLSETSHLRVSFSKSTI